MTLTYIIFLYLHYSIYTFFNILHYTINIINISFWYHTQLFSIHFVKHFSIHGIQHWQCKNIQYTDNIHPEMCLSYIIHRPGHNQLIMPIILSSRMFSWKRMCPNKVCVLIMVLELSLSRYTYGTDERKWQIIVLCRYSWIWLRLILWTTGGHWA